MNSKIIKFLSLFLSIILAALFCASCSSETDSAQSPIPSSPAAATPSPEEIDFANFKAYFYDNYQNDSFDVNNIALTFAVISDLHIGLYQQDTKVANGMQFLSKRAINGLDAVLVNGDLTNSYRASKDESHISLVKDTLVNNLPEGTSFFYTLGTSHDADGFDATHKSGKDQREVFNRVLGDKFSTFDTDVDSYVNKGYKHAIINNYHFLGLDNENGDYSKASLTWLKNKLTEITKEEPNKSVFVMTHIPASNDLDDVLRDFPQVIYFSAHEHIPFNTPEAITQSKYTSLSIGGFAYYREANVDSLSLQDNNNNYEYGQGYLIEVDSNGNTRVLRADLYNEIFLNESWVIPAPKEDSSHLEIYKSKKNEKAVFAEDAQIEISVDETNIFAPVKITFPAATASDGQPVTMYNVVVEIEEGSGTVRTERMNISSMYMKYPNGIGMPDSYTVTVDGVASPYAYKVTVKAYNCLSRVSSPLKGELKTPGYDEILGLNQ